ncbi:hypothetical protein ABPG77_002205 [Micractinium sp. CCAP 211/92]
MASDTLVEAVTGLSFPTQQQFWHGGPLRCLGAGARVKKVGFMSVKVYAVAMYVNAGAAAEASKQAKQPSSDAAALDVLTKGAFDKALQMRLVRGVTGKQFSEALDESLRPVMTGDEAALSTFSSFFHDKQLDNGTEVTLFWRSDGPTDVCLRPPSDAGAPYASQSPSLSIACPRLGQALWEVYLSPSSPAPEARKAWLAAVGSIGT